MKGSFQSIEVSYFVHATEDARMLDECVRRVLGIGSAPDEEMLQGHFGNAILRVRHHLTGEEAAAVFARLGRSLTPEAARELHAGLGAMLDEHSALYVRLDKQSFFSGRLALGGRDPVRVRVKPRLFTLKEGALAFFRRELRSA